MSLADIRRRLDRIERIRAGRDPAAMPRAGVLYVAPGDDTAPQLAGMIERGEHRRGWPVLAIRADWSAVHAVGGTR